MRRALLVGAITATGLFMPAAEAGLGPCTGANVINTISIGGMFNCTLDTVGSCTQQYGNTAFVSFPSNSLNASLTYANCLVF